MQPDQKPQKVDIHISLLSLSSKRHLAVTTLGGISVRGKSSEYPMTAVRQLLLRLADHNDDEAAIALELAAQGASLDERLALAGADAAPAEDPGTARDDG